MPPRDAAGRLPRREFSEDEVTEAVARRCAKESLRSIEKATGIPRSTLAELFKRPEVVAMVADIQADAAKVETPPSADVPPPASRAPEAAKPSSSAPSSPPARRTGREKKKARRLQPGDGHVLGILTWDTQGRTPVETFGFGREESGAASGETLTEEIWQKRKADERALASYPLPIVVHYEGIHGPGKFGVDVNDPEDLSHRARQLSAEGLGSPRAIAATLAEVKPGALILLRLEQPAPDEGFAIFDPPARRSADPHSTRVPG